MEKSELMEVCELLDTPEKVEKSEETVLFITIP
jgi:hypothetical protein